MTRTPPLDPKIVSLLWAGPERAAEIAGMHARLFPPGWGEEGVARMLDNPAATSFVAQVGAPKITVGYVMGQVTADEAEILSLGVAPELQRRGLGTQLVNGLIRAVQRAEAKRLYLEVAADNAPAIALYGKLGFAETTRRKGYYHRPGASPVDAVVLQKAL
jgi:ribosomal-protein-alanine N-acetyltransferase